MNIFKYLQKTAYRISPQNLFLILCCSVLIYACKKGEADATLNSNLVIQSGFVCGWGAGTDSLRVSQYEVTYTFYIPRLSQQPQFRKSRPITKKEWLEICQFFKVDDFAKLTYNTCNTCFDGCDEWIAIKSDQSDHKITFNKGMRIDSISQLQLKIWALKTELTP
jgi:hypothetical protein